MKYFRAVLIVVGAMVLLGYASLHAADPRTRGVRITPRSELNLAGLYGASHAVIIGINTYTGLPSVEYAIKDARAMEQRLLSMGFQTTVLLDQQATSEGILTVLGEELPRKVQQRDRVVIFFAGLAATEERPDGTQMGYLLPIDADSTRVFATSISIDQIREISARIQANHVLFLVDSCIGGLGLTAPGTVAPGDRNYFQKVASQKGHQLLTAGGNGETAQINEEGLSLFAAYVLEGLSGAADRDGKGFITSYDLSSYVRFQVSRLTAAKQTTQFGNMVGRGNMVFATAGGPTAAKAGVPGSGQSIPTAPIPSPSKADRPVAGQDAENIVPPPPKPETTEVSQKESPKIVGNQKAPEADRSSLATKQAQMEELKRLDAERRKTKVAVKQTAAPATEAAQVGRFVAYDNGTVLDTRTGLMWAAKDNGSNITWENAKRYCENYRAGGYTDWRLPTLEELAGLYDETVTNTNPPTAGCHGGYRLTNLIHLSCCCPWAADTRGSKAAYYGFHNGPQGWIDQSYVGRIRALPVRSTSK